MLVLIFSESEPVFLTLQVRFYNRAVDVQAFDGQVNDVAQLDVQRVCVQLYVYLPHLTPLELFYETTSNHWYTFVIVFQKFFRIRR